MKRLVAGVWHPLRVKRIYATGSTTTVRDGADLFISFRQGCCLIAGDSCVTSFSAGSLSHKRRARRMRHAGLEMTCSARAITAALAVT